MFINVPITRCSGLVIFYFKSSVFWHALESHLWDVYSFEDLVEKIISPVLFDTNRAFKWLNTLSLTKELFINFFYGARSHLVIFIFLQRKVCVSAPVSKLVSWTVFPCGEKIFRLCLLHEDGIVEACIPSSIWQKSVNFWFNGKIMLTIISQL